MRTLSTSWEIKSRNPRTYQKIPRNQKNYQTCVKSDENSLIWCRSTHMTHSLMRARWARPRLTFMDPSKKCKKTKRSSRNSLTKRKAGRLQQILTKSSSCSPPSSVSSRMSKNKNKELSNSESKIGGQPGAPSKASNHTSSRRSPSRTGKLASWLRKRLNASSYTRALSRARDRLSASLSVRVVLSLTVNTSTKTKMMSWIWSRNVTRQMTCWPKWCSAFSTRAKS